MNRVVARLLVLVTLIIAACGGSSVSAPTTTPAPTSAALPPTTIPLPEPTATPDASKPVLLLVDQGPGSGMNPLRVRPVDPATLADLPGYTPMDFGHHYQCAFSPDGRTLAAFVWPRDTGRSGTLHLIDLATWTDTVPDVPVGDAYDLMFGPAGDGLFWIAPTTRDTPPSTYALHRYGITDKTVSKVVTFADSLLPREMRMLANGRCVAIYGVAVDGNNLANGAPHVMIVDIYSSRIVADVELPGVKDWQYREETADGMEYVIYMPGLAWDIPRERLYIAHADANRVTVVDLVSGSIAAERDIRPQTSRLRQVVEWLVPTAVAKGGEYVQKSAFVSDDGKLLYVLGDTVQVLRTSDLDELGQPERVHRHPGQTPGTQAQPRP